MNNIKTSSDKYVDSIWELATKNAGKFGNEEELVNFVKEKTKPNFDNYVDTVFSAHRISRHGYDEASLIFF